MIKKCVICWDNFLLKVANQLTCNNKNCKKERERQNKNERLKNPEYMEKCLKKRKEQSKIDYIKHKERYLKNAKKLKYELICKCCGKEFMGYSKKLKLCSEKCEINLLRLRVWENNPAYRNWLYMKWKKEIHYYKYREFEKNCKILDEKLIDEKWFLYCQNCWITNPLKFEHHHLIYRSEKPKHKFLHNIQNIYLLCIKCHNDFHKKKWIRNKIVEERKLNELFWDDVLNK